MPGKRAPVLITEEMVRVDEARQRHRRPRGGDRRQLRADAARRDVDAATACSIIGPLNLAASMPLHASQMFSRNVLTLLQHLIKDGQVVIDLNDEITGPMCVVHDGQVRS